MPEKKKRRANNEGSIRKRKSGLWEAQYTVGYKENGKCNTCAECMSCPENTVKTSNDEKENEHDE